MRRILRTGRALLARRVLLGALALAGFPGLPPAPAAAQTPLAVRTVLGSSLEIPTEAPLGFSSVPASRLEDLGWSFEMTREGVRIRGERIPELRIQAGNPFIGWGEETLQLAQAPAIDNRELWIPVQLLTDLLPYVAPAAYRYDAPSSTLLELTPDGRDPPVIVRTPPLSSTRVVVIDPGHGGRDPGTVGPGGVREKDIALEVALALARLLGETERYEVYLTREEDELIPIWDRGEAATHLKGDHPGVFLSLHVNAAPGKPEVRGFETYFLSEARTEHERRVAALENAPLALAGEEGVALDEADPELGFILNELRNLDHAHWSALLAETVQDEMARIHPGPDRGVKQGPLAVITNALMPGVLVEIGFVSNPDEERLMASRAFQEEVAGALERAVDRFFQRYPPGAGEAGPRATGGSR